MRIIESFKNRSLNERGFGMMAIMPVLAIVLIISVMGFGLMTRTTNATHTTNRETASARAVYAAEAGVNDYLWHLNKNNDYYNSTTTVHPALGLDGFGQQKWLYLEGSSDTAFHLEVSQTTDSPGVIVEATGRVTVGDATTQRNVRAILKKKSFTRYIYFTNYEKTPPPSSSTIYFITGDRIRGPLHTNDTVHIIGDPVFEKKVTTAETISKGAGDHPDFQQGYEEHVPVISMPQTNSSLKNWSDSSVGGYYYYGRTTIVLNSNGTMSVTNTNTLSTAVTGTADNPVVLPIPASGVVYVDGVGSTKGALNTGDVYVKGTLNGRLTIASENNIYIFGDITYANTETAMLGLVAENYVYILHKWSSLAQMPPYGTNGSVDVAPENIEINAAIFAVNYSFGYEDYTQHDKGTLTVRGSIAQMYRGPVGTTAPAGYAKDYHYDERMLYLEPPHFVNPLGAGFEVVTWSEF